MMNIPYYYNRTMGSVAAFLLFFMTIAACTNLNTVESTTETPDVQPMMDQQEHTRLHVLFLGDDGLHQPEERIQEVIPYLAKRGIYITYTDRQEDLNLKRLRDFDVFMFYGNRSTLPADQEKALLEYVADGGGLVTIHSASASFLNSDAFTNLVGGAFNSHGAEVFSTEYILPDHPVLKDVPNFESWDETYVHVAHNPDKTILSVREEGDRKEPWTWVRNYGDGRVFYTAWGHDSRTWTNSGFQKLLENGLRWTAGDWALDADFAPPEFTYGEGKLPYYPPGEEWGTTGDPITQIQNPLSPEESLEHLAVDPDFRIETFATDPEIVNPIDMVWDEKGRLWIAETLDYPNDFAPDREGNDRIKILEDTDGDGKADEITVFAEGLNIPTSLVLANGGVIVSQAPDFLFLKDTTGDDKADHREVLFSGWGTFDTHAGPNNLHYGFNNRIWGTVGYSAFEGDVGGEEHKFSQGIYHFSPGGSSLEFVSNTTNNTWGLGFNEEGVVFSSTANANPAVHSAIPNRFYDKVEGLDRPRLPMIATTDDIYPIADSVRQVDQHGRFTAASGFHVYTARDFPKEYWNRIAFVSEPTGHLMSKFIIEPDQSDFVADNSWNFIASRDEWFSPIQAKVGPDGALWFIDWYNLVIQHNPTPDNFELGEGNAYVNELRDRNHARIYRVVYKDSDSMESYSLEDASIDKLIDALQHDNLFWRLTAQRLLVERGEEDVLPMLYELIEESRVDELGLAPGALHALWTLHGLGVMNGSHPEALAVASNALYHPSSSVRRSALHILPRDEETTNKILESGILPNPDVPGGVGYRWMSGDPQVRLAALLALAEMPVSDTAGKSIAESLLIEENANDKLIRDAATAAAAQHKASFLGHILQKQLHPRADSTFTSHITNTVRIISENYAADSPSDSIMDWLSDLTQGDPSIGVAFVEGLAEGWPEEAQSARSDADRDRLQELKSELPDSFHQALDSLAEKWDSM